MNTTFDAIVVGAGQAGPSLVGRLTGAGMRVALVERHLIGGTCVNTGCTPTKALVASARVAHMARRAADFGIGVADVKVDMKAVKARKDAIVLRSRHSNEAWLSSMPGCTLLRGHARFESPKQMRVGEQVLTAERIFLNVGGRALLPDMPGLGEIEFLTNTSILELDELPEHLVIVGGSYVGLEFAQIYRRFGSKVTVVEKASRLISREDEDVSKAVEEILRGEGIDIRLDSHCIGFQPSGDKISVGLDCATGDRTVVGSHVLLAVGRRPNTDDLGLDKAGVATSEHGYIVVDDRLQTNVPGIWALGDCNGRGAFTHTAYNDFEIVAANLLDNDPRRVSDRIEAYALYIDPPLGRAGLSESAARRAGHKIRVGKRPMTRVGRAVEKGETQGFMKVVVDADGEQILGAAILGVGGDEAVHSILDTMSARAPYRVLQRTVHIHPTVAELIPTVLDELQP
jgi:pyruvate/2-oxoglutarate dehydrogenase complex dihydrolipoamide dehydrogenase (E3) component